MPSTDTLIRTMTLKDAAGQVIASTKVPCCKRASQQAGYDHRKADEAKLQHGDRLVTAEFSQTDGRMSISLTFKGNRSFHDFKL